MKSSFSFLLLAALLLSVSASPSTAPYPAAPVCAGHDQSEWHALWNEAAGCHYAHEHGDDPFTPAVAAAFPDFDLLALLGGVEVGHPHPTGPAENTTKHGGMKWQVTLPNPSACIAGFEGAAYCVTAAVIQYHAFGQASIEFESRTHSTVAMLKVCDPANPSDCGYLFTIAHQDYGQRVAPYQGAVLPYPDNFLPTWPGGFGPYFTTDCYGTGLTGCRPSLAFVRDRNLNANSIWTSKPTGTGPRPPAALLFRLLFRTRDTYQLLNSADLSYPFTFGYVCGNTVYNPAGCRYNNSTTRVHEVAGTIPAYWDGDTWDADPRVGRVTGEGELDGMPFKVVGMFVGQYGSELTAVKVSNPTVASNPERDVYFCAGVVCAETSPGAVPSGWLGVNN